MQQHFDDTIEEVKTIKAMTAKVNILPKNQRKSKTLLDHLLRKIQKSTMLLMFLRSLDSKEIVVLNAKHISGNIVIRK